MTRTRTIVLIVLTVVVAAVFVATVVPKWRRQQLSSPNQSPSYTEKVVDKQADAEAIWRPAKAANSPNPGDSRKVKLPKTPPKQPPRVKINIPTNVGSNGKNDGNGGERLLTKKLEKPQKPESLENSQTSQKYKELMGLLHQLGGERKNDNNPNAPKREGKVPIEELEEQVKKLLLEKQKAANKAVPVPGANGMEQKPVREHRSQELGMRHNMERTPQRSGMEQGAEIKEQRRGMELRPGMEQRPARPDINKEVEHTPNDRGGNRGVASRDSHREIKAPPSLPITTTEVKPVSIVTTPRPINLNLPFIKKGNVEIRPERLPPPAGSSDIYFSLLTAPVYHNLRFSLQYLTWLQTVDPKQVNVITDKDNNEWIKAIKKEGAHIYLPTCPLSTRKTREMMCCKTGAQFDYWYRAKEAGAQYKWYCHFDDDLYVNVQAIVNMLKKYDPTTDRYLGAWTCVGRVHGHNRIPGNMLAPKLLQVSERKRDDFRYANGPSYCISEALMTKVEKYLRGKRFEETCRRTNVIMDDVLPGVVIDGILGIDMNVTDEFMSQMDFPIHGNSQQMRQRAQNILSIGYGRFTITDGRFNSRDDSRGVLSYHCLLHPEVSWCRR